jgi:membrane-associated phospholipid phosphatase
MRDGTPGPPVRHGWWLDGLLLAAFGGLTAALVWWPSLITLDLAVRDWADAHRPPPVADLLWVFDHLGQGGPLITVTLIVGIWLSRRRRTVRPLLPAVAAPILTSAVIVSLKRWTERGAPHYGPVHLFSGAGSVEYPSGHVANGLVYYGVLVLLLGPYLSAAARVLLRWLPGVLVFVGTTGLGYHWLTDSVGGYLIGLLMVRALLRIPWATLPLPAVLDGRRP